MLEEQVFWTPLLPEYFAGTAVDQLFELLNSQLKKGKLVCFQMVLCTYYLE